MNKTCFNDLGTRDYLETWNYQEEVFNRLVETKLYNRLNQGEEKEIENHLILVEHPHVYTLGKSGMQGNLLITPEFLDKIGARFYQTNRGGDITYHGPGQVVGYPIFDLEGMKIGAKEYIFRLEEAIIITLKEFGVDGGRLDGATGVWLDSTEPRKARKICAIGVRVSRLVTMHGFALNVNTNLDYFKYINPCGMIDKGVTTLQNELGGIIPLQEIKNSLKESMKRCFALEYA